MEPTTRRPYCGSDIRQCGAEHTAANCEVKAAEEAERVERTRKLEAAYSEARVVGAPIDWVAKALMADDLIRSASSRPERLRIVEKCLRWAAENAPAPSFQETTDEIRRIEDIASEWLSEFGPDVERRDIRLCHVVELVMRTRSAR